IPYAFPFKPGADSKGKVRVDGALYPFGYGLSYTTFEYKDLKISSKQIGLKEDVMVSCTIKNTGKRDGDEVVQLYIHEERSYVSTCSKLLRGFERLKLKSGEEKTIVFKLSPQDLALWDRHNEFVVEPGMFKVMIGASSQDIRLEDTLTAMYKESFEEE